MARINKILSASKAKPANLIDLSRDARFQTCTPALQAVLQRIAAKPLWPVFFHGDQGRGKSVAAQILMRCYCGKAYGTDFGTWASGEPYAPIYMTCSEAIKTFMDELFTGKSLFRKHWRNAPIAILDDLATRALTDPQLDALLQIINMREGKPLVATCNLSASDIQRNLKDARIPSRLSAGWVVEVTGNDRRLEGRERVTA